MNPHEKYDIAIAGGGLAGLALSIQLADRGYKVVLFEKEQYPFHRVCGEYISLESWDFLKSLGLSLDQMHLPQISKILVSGKNGTKLQEQLPLGGFGISRYELDHQLATIARKRGVALFESTRVNDVGFNGDEFIFKTNNGDFSSKAGVASYGKRSNLDIKWKRPFTSMHSARLDNYVGIKYHVKADLPPDTIALHWFHKGYCGIVKIDGDKHNLCYLTTADNLQKYKGNINEMEEQVLLKNPALKELWPRMGKVNETPVTISQISFDKKSQIENHLLMVGDAAGMITPLCGNGMSMALHGSKIAFEAIDKFLSGKISRQQMEQLYDRDWNSQFSSRLRTGRWIQSMLFKPGMDNLFINTGKLFPFLLRSLIKRTHGKAF